MSTTFMSEYGVGAPIVQAAMGVVSMPALVAAVSNAGGMGTLGAVGTPLVTPAELSRLIKAIRALTDAPFGVNFISQLVTDDHVRACVDARVPVVSFHMGRPPDRMINRLKGNGARVWLQVTSVEESKDAIRAGADAVIAQGFEAGGSNRGATGSLTLVPAVVDAVTPVPVLAAGGIADGRGLAAALALGADAVWVGTRFLASREANAHAEYKRRVVAAADGDTAITSLFAEPKGLRRPVRVIRNRVVTEWSEDDTARSANGAGDIGLTELGGRFVAMHKFSTLLPTPETTGDFEEMCLLAGESVALIHDIRPAAEIVHTMMAQARCILGNIMV